MKNASHLHLIITNCNIIVNLKVWYVPQSQMINIYDLYQFQVLPDDGRKHVE